MNFLATPLHRYIYTNSFRDATWNYHKAQEKWWLFASQWSGLQCIQDKSGGDLSVSGDWIPPRAEHCVWVFRHRHQVNLSLSIACSIALGVFMQNMSTNSWRGKKVKTESEIGQLLVYLMAAHFRRLQVLRHMPDASPVPILGLFMEVYE